MLNPQENRSLEILLLIARKGPLNKYGICKALVPKYGSEPTILYAVRDLTEQEGIGAIRVARTERGARGPKGISKYYDLTPLGLLKLIVECKIDRGPDEDVRMLAQRYRRILSIFDLWPAVIAANAESQAQKILRMVCAMLPLASLRHRDVPLRSFLYPTQPFLSQDDSRKWVKAVSENDVLRAAMAKVVHELATDSIREANHMLRLLSERELTLTSVDQIKDLRKELDDLKLRMDILAHATGYSIRPQEVKEEGSASPRAAVKKA